jgi:hypothetical protein
MASKTTKTRGVGLLTVLFVVFLVLKLTGVGAVASWSWWWVTCPLWIIPALWLGLVACFGLLALVYGITVERK